MRARARADAHVCDGPGYLAVGIRLPLKKVFVGGIILKMNIKNANKSLYTDYTLILERIENKRKRG